MPQIISFCHPANVTPSALIMAVSKVFCLPVSKGIMEAAGEVWDVLHQEISTDALKPDPRATFDDLSASSFNDSITSIHTDERAVYLVPVNTDPADAILRCLLLSSVEDVELGQSVWGWDGETLTPIIKASDAECDASA
jgi:hypothetical protein